MEAFCRSEMQVFPIVWFLVCLWRYGMERDFAILQEMPFHVPFGHAWNERASVLTQQGRYYHIDS